MNSEKMSAKKMNTAALRSAFNLFADELEAIIDGMIPMVVKTQAMLAEVEELAEEVDNKHTTALNVVVELKGIKDEVEEFRDDCVAAAEAAKSSASEANAANEDATDSADIVTKLTASACTVTKTAEAVLAEVASVIARRLPAHMPLPVGTLLTTPPQKPRLPVLPQVGKKRKDGAVSAGYGKEADAEEEEERERGRGITQRRRLTTSTPRRGGQAAPVSVFTDALDDLSMAAAPVSPRARAPTLCASPLLPRLLASAPMTGFQTPVRPVTRGSHPWAPNSEAEDEDEDEEEGM